MELYYHLWNSNLGDVSHPSARSNLSASSDLSAPSDSSKKQGWASHPSPKITLLHGMGGTGSLWRPIAATLEDSYTVLAPDQRGHGKSRLTQVDEGGEFAPLDYGKDVIDTLASLKFYPTWILGHSMGVRTALAAAHLKSEWVRGLILVDLGLSGAAGGGLGETLENFLKILPEEFNNRTQARAFMASHCPDPSIAQYLMAVSTVGAEGRVTFPFHHAALIRTIQLAAVSTVRDWVMELAQKNMPILIVRGQESLVWSRSEYEAERARFVDYPSVRFVEVPGAGHGLPFEKRAEFLKLICDFMNRS